MTVPLQQDEIAAFDRTAEATLLPAGVARPAFRGLAAARRVRGTPLDLFGRDRHRREERALVEEYGALVEAALAGPHDEAVALASSIQAVRGYEDIKSEAIARWREQVAP